MSKIIEIKQAIEILRENGFSVCDCDSKLFITIDLESKEAEPLKKELEKDLFNLLNKKQ